MTGGTAQEFVDYIYTCQDAVFVYKGIKYWFQGYMPTTDTVHMEVFQYEPPSDGFIWEYDGKTIEECQQAFLSALIFDGKNFWDVEQDIAWIDY